MRNRFLVIVVVTGVLAPSSAALATDGTSGGAEAPSPGSQKTEPRHKRVRLPKELKKIAQCESGGDPRAISPDGRYRGKYQFSRATWRTVGGHGDPAKASEYEQDKRALKLYKREGTAPWPNCA